ncbi:Transcription factor GRAS, partial [Dillenia turbinata]
MVSIQGDRPLRIAAYVVEGLAARMAASGKGLYKALRCKEPSSWDCLIAMQILFEVCPGFKFGFMAANGPILEAFSDEERDPESVQRTVGGLRTIGQRLEKLAEAVGVPFEFRAVAAKTADVTPTMLNCRPGEALVVNFATCQMRLFIEAYNHAVFESLDAMLPRKSPDRINVEKQCLARDIVNVVACEGEERIERYEVAGKWRARMTMAGFTSCPLTSICEKLHQGPSIQSVLQQIE